MSYQSSYHKPACRKSDFSIFYIFSNSFFIVHHFSQFKEAGYELFDKKFRQKKTFCLS